jgi:hypothetical protein
MKPSQKRLRSFNNGVTKPKGQASLNCQTTVSGKKVNEYLTFQVVKGEVAPILGKYSCKKMGLVEKVHQVSMYTDPPVLKNSQVPKRAPNPPKSQPQSKPDKSKPREPSKRSVDLPKKNQDLFEGLGCVHGREYDIAIDPNVQPVQLPLRQIPHKIHDKVKTELERMTNLGEIEPVTEPTEWVSQITTVTKKNGSVRVCLYPQDLNKTIRRQHYPMTTLETVEDKSLMPHRDIGS